MEIISRKEAIEKGLKRYFTGKPCKYGHVSERYVVGRDCLECSKRISHKWNNENKDRKKKYMKEYNADNKSHIKYIKAVNKNKYQVVKNKYKRKQYKENVEFKTSIVCRKMLERVLKATSSTKNTSTYELLGYCNEQLKESIEDKFFKGMSWDNYGDWHIDHIYPVSRYIKDRVEDPAIINHLDNLIPMWSEHNLEKSDRTLEEYLEDRKDLIEIYGRFL